MSETLSAALLALLTEEEEIDLESIDAFIGVEATLYKFFLRRRVTDPFSRRMKKPSRFIQG